MPRQRLCSQSHEKLGKVVCTCSDPIENGFYSLFLAFYRDLGPSQTLLFKLLHFFSSSIHTPNCPAFLGPTHLLGPVTNCLVQGKP